MIAPDHPGAPIRLRYQADLQYEVLSPTCDFIFNLQATRTAHQRVVSEKLEISQPVQPQAFIDAATNSRYLRLRAEKGPLRVYCETVVDLVHHRAPPATLPEVSIAELPADTLSYLYPSRYCQSDRLNRFAFAEFGGLEQGYGRVQAIRDWVQGHVEFVSNTSDANTSAVDTLVTRQGVCRDFAHLMIALCRAVNIPARFTTGIDYGADPALGPARLPRVCGSLRRQPLVHVRSLRHRDPHGLHPPGDGPRRRGLRIRLHLRQREMGNPADHDRSDSGTRRHLPGARALRGCALHRCGAGAR